MFLLFPFFVLLKVLYNSHHYAVHAGCRSGHPHPAAGDCGALGNGVQNRNLAMYRHAGKVAALCEGMRMARGWPEYYNRDTRSGNFIGFCVQEIKKIIIPRFDYSVVPE